MNNKVTVNNTYRSGATWYRKWSDGWIEQGGTGPVDKGTHTVTLPTAFTTTNYTIMTQSLGAKYGDYYSCITSRSTTQFVLSVGSAFANGFMYYACGY